MGSNATPYVSKKQLEAMVAQLDARLNATMALLEEALRACPESEVRVYMYTERDTVARTHKLVITYDKNTDVLIAQMVPL